MQDEMAEKMSTVSRRVGGASERRAFDALSEGVPIAVRTIVGDESDGSVTRSQRAGKRQAAALTSQPAVFVLRLSRTHLANAASPKSRLAATVVL